MVAIIFFLIFGILIGVDLTRILRKRVNKLCYLLSPIIVVAFFILGTLYLDSLPGDGLGTLDSFFYLIILSVGYVMGYLAYVYHALFH